MFTILKITITLLLLLILALWIGVHFVAPYAILQPQRQPSTQKPAGSWLKFESWTIKGVGDVDLSAYYVQPIASFPRANIILLPGVGSNKEAWLGLAEVLAKQHISTVLLDHRAQGQSGGEYATYGELEKQDISRVIDRIEALHPGLPLGIWGHSFGGAVALQSMAHDKRIDFGISQSTFARLEVIVADYFQRGTGGWGPRWLAKYALKRAGKIAGFKPQEIQPLLAAAQIKQPILIVHGSQDLHITVDNAHLIFDQLASEEKELIIVDGADHNNVGIIGGDELFDQQMAYINWQLQ